MMRTLPRWLVALSLVGATAGGCEGKSTEATDTDPTGDSGGIPPITTGVTTTENPADSGTGQGTADGDTGPTPTGGFPDDTAAEGTASTDGGGSGGGGTPVDCGGTTYACGDGEDNDGDGRVDLLDPECTGPCDDDESSFQTGIPGDNMDCRQDCFFDGNSGQGDDGCLWDLRCDPENPGEFIGCEYTGGMSCENSPPNQDPDCIENCEPLVPPGCDCFGCCEVQTDEGSVWIFLNSHPDCALDNLDACTQCTPQIEDCGNPCVPEDCELCFGEDEPPEGCKDPSCPEGIQMCEINDDCPADFFCYLNCCYPPPPG